MKIGVDISVIQTPHLMRGIGATLINFIGHLSNDVKENYEFVLYVNDTNDKSYLASLDLSGLKYEFRTKKIKYPAPNHSQPAGGLVGKVFRLLSNMPRHFSNFASLHFGDTCYGVTSDLNSLLVFDQNQTIPSPRKVKSYVVAYDLIPYILEADYLWSYNTSRKHGRTRKRSLLMMLARKKYYRRAKIIAKKAHRLIAISEHTKQDFVKYLGTDESKIITCHLGVDMPSGASDWKLREYVDTSWGPITRNLDLRKKKFLLFVGGADPRRKLAELVAALNNLRARDYDICLVMAGDTMFGKNSMPNHELQLYLDQTSYLEHIHFVGFVSIEQRNWLYQHCLAFVYPSIYEGFGLPVLEAMVYGTPVITYRNSSIEEVANDSVIYADDPTQIIRSVIDLLNEPGLRDTLSIKGRTRSSSFSWDVTTKNIISSVLQIKN